MSMKKTTIKADQNIHNWNELDVDYLITEKGIKCVVLDVDGTITHERKILPGVKETIEELRKKNVQVAILSNNFAIDKKIHQELQVDKKKVRMLAFKPFQSGYKHIIKVTKCKPEEIAMITNNSFLDVFGANRSGMYTIKLLEHENRLEKMLRRIRDGKQENKDPSQNIVKKNEITPEIFRKKARLAYILDNSNSSKKEGPKQKQCERKKEDTGIEPEE